MSDTPQGGWWKAKDGKWYPPETHPDHERLVEVPEAGPAAEGWWQANDGNWYPPESHPDHQVESGEELVYDLTDPAPPIETSLSHEPVALADPEQSSSSPAGPSPTAGLFNLGAEDARAGGADARWGSPSGRTTTQAPTDLTPGDWNGGAPAAVPALGGDDPDAPLPGWRKGADGNWYPPGQEPVETPGPAAASSDSLFDLTAGSVPPAPTAPGAGATGDRRRLFLILGAAAAVAVLVVAGLVLLRGGDDSPAGDEQDAASAPETSEGPAATDAPALTTTSTTAVVEPPGQVSGSGSAVVALDRTVTEPYLALVTHDGPGGFGLAFLDADGAVVEEPVGGATFGDYLGWHPVNFLAGESVASVRVDGEGPWAVTFALVESAPSLAPTPGSTYEGRGDRVVKFSADESSQVAVACSGCSSAASVIAWSGTGAPGTPLTIENDEVTVPSGTRYLQVLAQGAAGVLPDWTLTSS